jgi:hypothetical protein
MKATRYAVLLLPASMAGAALPYEQIKAYAQTGAPLKLERCVDWPGYTGDFDHYAVDTVRGRLLLAAEDHGTLEIFDLKTTSTCRQ